MPSRQAIAQEDVSLWKQFAEILSKNYYAPQRFNPQLFLSAYVDFLQKDLYLLKVEKVTNEFSWSIGEKKYEIKIDDSFDFFAAFKACEKIFVSLPADWWVKCQIPRDKVYYQALSAALKTLDPHTKILSPHDTRRYLDRSGNLIYSVGLWVQKNNGQYEVHSVYQDSPAEEANISPGDILLEVNGQNLQELPLVAVQNLLESNMKDITIELQKLNGAREAYNIEAEPVQRSSLSYKLMNGEVGYIRLERFSKNTHEQFVHAWKELKTGMPSVAYFDQKQGWKFEEIPDKNEFGSLQSLVIDLRGNPGGLLEEAVKICEEFLPKDKPIVLVNTNNEKTRKLYANSKDGDLKLPLIILIDENSASAAEILSGCLQHYNRALVIGRNSFGKGSVQEAVLLAAPEKTENQNNELVFFKYLIAEYFVGNDVPIQNLGITPNLQIDEVALKKDDIKLQPVKPFRESDYDTAIKSLDSLPRLNVNIFKKFIFWREPSANNSREHASFNFPLEVALKLLRGEEAREGEAWNMKEFYYRKKDLCASLEVEQMQKLHDKFTELGLDWKSGGPYSKNFKPVLEFKDDKDGKKIIEVRLGVKNEIVLSLKNTSAIPAYRIRGVIELTPLSNEPLEIYWGQIKSSGEQSAKTNLELPRGATTGDFEGKVSVFDENHFLFEKKIIIRVLKQDLVEFSFRAEKNDVDQDHVTIKIKNTSTKLSEYNTFKVLAKGSGEQAAYPKAVRNLPFVEKEPQTISFGLLNSLSTNDLLFSYTDEDCGIEVRLPLDLIVNRVDDSYCQVPLKDFASLVECKSMPEFSAMYEKIITNNQEVEALWISTNVARLSLWGKAISQVTLDWKPSYCTVKMVLKNAVQIRKKVYLK